MPESARIGIVLSSGGIRGVFAHTGFMQAIQALGIPVHASVGCSAGALVGGFLASGTSLQSWSESLSNVDSSSFWTPDSVLKFLWQMAAHKGRGYTGISDTSAATQFTLENLAVNSFEECIYPFQTLAVNLNSGKKVVFSEGELAPRMVASATMPILYQPKEIDGEYYCDGALIDFAPTDAICCKYNLDVVIVNHVSQIFGAESALSGALKDSWALLEIVNRLIFRVRPWYLTDEPICFHRCPCGCGAVVIVLEPDLPNMPWPTIEGGNDVLLSTKEQVKKLLDPYMEKLMENPREGLPFFKGEVRHPAVGCGHNR